MAAFTLPDELTIYTAGELRTALLAWLAEPADDGGRRLDGGAVLEVDGAGIQVLVALQRSLQARGDAWCWESASDALRAACRDLGCGALLMTDTEAAS